MYPLDKSQKRIVKQYERRVVSVLFSFTSFKYVNVFPSYIDLWIFHEFTVEFTHDIHSLTKNNLDKGKLKNIKALLFLE